MDQIYATLLSDVIGADVINSTLQELEQNYSKLYAQLSELVLPDGSNAGEIKDYSLHLVDAYLKLKQSELHRNPVLLRVLRSLGPVAKSYELSGQEDYVLHFDTALTVTLMALMCGLKDLEHVVAYSNYANQYLQLLLPRMVHPRYRISLPNCRSAMRLVNCEMMERFYTNFFTRAKVATKLVAPAVLKALQPNIKLAGAGIKAQLSGLSREDLPAFLPCLGLAHGLILGPRTLLFLCADQFVVNGYHYLLSLDHLPMESQVQFQALLAATSNSKILIDRIDSYYDLLDEISEDMQTVVCIKRLDQQTRAVECHFFLSTLPQVEESLYLIKAASDECEQGLKQSGSYLMTIAPSSERAGKEADPLYLPLRSDYNRFIVNVLSYERELEVKLKGNGAVKPWDEVLYRNGSNPICAMTSLFYYFLADVLDQEQMVALQRRRMFDLLGANP